MLIVTIIHHVASVFYPHLGRLRKQAISASLENKNPLFELKFVITQVLGRYCNPLLMGRVITGGRNSVDSSSKSQETE